MWDADEKTSPVTTEDDPGSMQAYQALKKKILSGGLRPFDRLPGLRDLCSDYGISYRVAVRTTEKLAQEGLVTRRRGSGTYVNEVTRLKVLNSDVKVIQVILTYDFGYPAELVQRPMIAAMKEALSDIGCTHFFCRRAMDEVADYVKNEEAHAFVWVCPSIRMTMPVPKAPMVIVAQDIEMTWPESSGYDIVTADSRQGGAVAARHLKEIGCRHVAILGARGLQLPELSPISTERIHGFEMGWGAKLPESAIVWAEQYGADSAARRVEAILSLDPRPDGIFATSDDLAAGLCVGLAAHGIEPGRDIKVIGFDAQPNSLTQGFKLTSVQVPYEELGKATAAMALERAAAPGSPMRRLSLGCSLQGGATA